MSTTFQVYPATTRIPSFAELLNLSTRRLREFLQEVGVPRMPTVRVAIGQKGTHADQPLDLTAPAIWPEDCYAWFTVPPIEGGTDAYVGKVEELDYNLLAEAPRVAQQERPLPHAASEYLAQGNYWTFRRSVGQHATIAVAYGLIAASFAELTDGILYSGNGGWDFQRFPATADEFFTWYFRPALALEEEYREWAERCIGHLAEELAG